jgi:hypothetical protein
MLSLLSVGILSVSPVAFDMTSVLGLFYPGRETVLVIGSDGEAMTYACKPGPAGETPREQAEKAQAAFETNLHKFADAWVAGMTEDLGEDMSSLETGLSLHLKAESWGGAITLHLEKEFGCALLG